MSDIPYQEVTHAAYAEDAARTFAVTEAGPGTVVLTGRCPRCAAEIEVPVVNTVYKSFRWRRRTAPAPVPDEQVEPLICTCTEPHPGRPEGRFGCGAYWLLTIGRAPS
ncbi:hypothetical protein [Streptomyces sp. NPDC001978]|uniref:hypothetical protein n=1 Tax=Streptomyces sp. NPDC001978 TaxID=3364627 RepID=UPI0036BD69E6